MHKWQACRLHDRTHAAACTTLSLLQIDLLFNDIPAVWSLVNIFQAQPIGSVTLPIRIARREGIEEDVTKVRAAAVADDLCAAPLRLDANMTTISFG